jgi:small subunit ribosomal protein S24e
MDIEIQTKTNNPLLNRTDVHFKVIHNGEQTPKRELIRRELAEKLKVKKDQVIIDNMKSHFGISQTKGYAKLYKNTKEAQSYERKHILKRNNASPTKDNVNVGEKTVTEEIPQPSSDVTQSEQSKDSEKPSEIKEELKESEKKKTDGHPPKDKKE